MSDRFIDIRFAGADELQQKLKKLEFALQKKIVRAANRKAMLQVRDRAKILVPVKSGDLRDSLHIKVKTRKGVHRVGVHTGARDELGIAPENIGYYPAALEYGYFSGAQNIPAKSYLRAALFQLKEKVLADVGKNIAAGIEKAIK